MNILFLLLGYLFGKSVNKNSSDTVSRNTIYFCPPTDSPPPDPPKQY